MKLNDRLSLEQLQQLQKILQHYQRHCCYVGGDEYAQCEQILKTLFNQFK